VSALDDRPVDNRLEERHQGLSALGYAFVFGGERIDLRAASGVARGNLREGEVLPRMVHGVGVAAHISHHIEHHGIVGPHACVESIELAFEQVEKPAETGVFVQPERCGTGHGASSRVHDPDSNLALAR